MEEFWTSLRCWWTLGIGNAWATPWSDVDIEGPQKGSRGPQDSQHWSLEKMQGRKGWNGEVMMRCSDTNLARFLTLYVVRTVIVHTCPNRSSSWSEFAQAEPMQDLVRSSRWEAWVMGSLVCPFWGKIWLKDIESIRSWLLNWLLSCWSGKFPLFTLISILKHGST